MKRTKLLCPIDFSETSLEALTYAADMAAKMDAVLVVGHAFSRPASWDREGQNHPDDETLEERIESLECSVPHETVLHAGPPGKVICWLAQEHDCDLIVMGTHGRTGLKHLLLGSTAEYVLQHARCPVLTVRHKRHGERPLEEPIVMPLPGPGA